MSYPIVDTDDGQTQERDPYVYWEGWRMTSMIHGKLEGRHQQQSTFNNSRCSARVGVIYYMSSSQGLSQSLNPNISGLKATLNFQHRHGLAWQ